MKTFTMIDEAFVCAFCGEENPPLGKSARNHCRKCLKSLHLDINPGDRDNDCRGKLEPTGIDIKSGKTMILFKCEKCGKIRKNSSASDDNYEEILRISVGNFI